MVFVILEWVMLNLLNYLDIFKKVRSEIDELIGLDWLVNE